MMVPAKSTTTREIFLTSEEQQQIGTKELDHAELISSIATRALDNIRSGADHNISAKDLYQRKQEWVKSFSTWVGDQVYSNQLTSSDIAVLKDIEGEVLRTIDLEIEDENALNNDKKLRSIQELMESLLDDFEKAKLVAQRQQDQVKNTVKELDGRMVKVEEKHNHPKKEATVTTVTSKNDEREQERVTQKKQKKKSERVPPRLQKAESLSQLVLQQGDARALVPYSQDSVRKLIKVGEDYKVVDALTMFCIQLIQISDPTQQVYNRYSEIHENCRQLIPLVHERLNVEAQELPLAERRRCREISRKVNQNLQIQALTMGNIIHDEQVEETKVTVEEFEVEFNECKKRYNKDNEKTQSLLKGLRERVDGFEEVEKKIHNLEEDVKSGKPVSNILKNIQEVKNDIDKIEDPIAKAVLIGLLIAVAGGFMLGVAGGLIATFAVAAPVAAGVGIGVGLGLLLGGVGGGLAGNKYREDTKSRSKEFIGMKNNPEEHFVMV